jgi:hypothetical protein
MPPPAPIINQHINLFVSFEIWTGGLLGAQLALSLERPKSQSVNVRQVVEFQSDSGPINLKTISLHFIASGANCVLIQEASISVLVNNICKIYGNTI